MTGSWLIFLPFRGVKGVNSRFSWNFNCILCLVLILVASLVSCIWTIWSQTILKESFGEDGCLSNAKKKQHLTIKHHTIICPTGAQGGLRPFTTMFRCNLLTGKHRQVTGWSCHMSSEETTTTIYPPKTNMTMENESVEDVFPIANRWIFQFPC